MGRRSYLNAPQEWLERPTGSGRLERSRRALAPSLARSPPKSRVKITLLCLPSYFIPRLRNRLFVLRFFFFSSYVTLRQGPGEVRGRSCYFSGPLFLLLQPALSFGMLDLSLSFPRGSRSRPTWCPTIPHVTCYPKSLDDNSLLNRTGAGVSVCSGVFQWSASSQLFWPNRECRLFHFFSKDAKCIFVCL